MSSKLFYRFLVQSSVFAKPPNIFRNNYSVLAESNVSTSNAPSQNLVAYFLTTRFNISSAKVAKILKFVPTLQREKSLDKVQQLVGMLNRHGFSDDYIAKLIRSHYVLFKVSAEVIEPKILMLKDCGMEGENVAKLVTIMPGILTTKLENLRSNINLLKTVFPSQHFLIKAITRNPSILKCWLQNTLKPSVVFWEEYGFRGLELTKFLLLNPEVLRYSSLTPAQLDLIHKIGIDKGSNLYKYVVSVVVNHPIEILEAKIDNLLLCGFTLAEAMELLRACPLLLTQSAENMKNKMNFILNHMELSIDFVAKRPRMLTMSLEKVMKPRFLVLQNMTSINGVGKVMPTRLFGILKLPEARFVGEIILGHPESAALWTIYKNAIANVPKNSKVRYPY